MDARTIGEKLTEAGRLSGRAVCVIGGDEPFTGAVPLGKIDRCIARAVYKLAVDRSSVPMYYGAEEKSGICGGGQVWCGLASGSSKLNFFVSTGTPDFMGGEAEYLKPSPEAAGQFMAAPGKLTPPARYISLAGYDQIDDDTEVLSFILIGKAESVRNLGGLIHFASEDLFTSILMPGGPSCASMVSYAAGMAERAPRNTAFVGPVDPTGNNWFPPDLLSMAVPSSLAATMAESADDSFLSKRPQVAFPERRLGLREERE
ncbi:MAG: DUF169 domain-containing protein [Methanomassiliicoccus sp.]|nr:DUF169 domain-containing protein [Methanomassiliicoccus sp.]